MRNVFSLLNKQNKLAYGNARKFVTFFCYYLLDTTGPVKTLFHYAIFQSFFTFFKYINGLCFTIHVIKLSCHYVSINHINV